MQIGKIARLGAVMALCGLLQFPAQASHIQADPAGAPVAEELREEARRVAAFDTAPRIETAVTHEAPDGDSILVGAIRIEGATALPPSAFAAVIESYAGRMLAPADLRALASDIANVARRSGYALATAWIPAQRSGNGILRVTLDEGRVDAVEVEGEASSVVRNILSPLANGRPVATAYLERQLLLAGDIAGVRLGKARIERRDGRNILHVKAARDRATARAYFDNWGTRAVGPVRARLSLDLNGLIAGDDQLSVSGVTTPLQPREYQFVRAAYTKRIGTGGTEFGLSGYYSRSQPGGAMAGRDIVGRSVEAEIGLRHPFVRTRQASLWGDVSLRVRDASLMRLGATSREDRLTIVSANAFGILKLPSGRARGRLTVSQGLGLLGAAKAGDPLASRSDADGTFSKLQFWGEVQHHLGRGWSLQAQAEGQIASGPLLSSEETGLGGRYFLRAYEYRERSGDSSAAASLELRFDLANMPKPLSSAQAYAFADAGTVGNAQGGPGGGSLASAGAGLRTWLAGKVEAGAEIAFPLADRLDPAQGQGPRFSFTLGTRF